MSANTYTIEDHYWKADDRVYSSKRLAYVDTSDKEYTDWLAAGGFTTPTLPVDMEGDPSEAVLRDMIYEATGKIAFPETWIPKELREKLYEAEVDPISKLASEYLNEAEGWKLIGDTEKETAAREKADAFLEQATLKKQEIRDLWPDAE